MDTSFNYSAVDDILSRHPKNALSTIAVLQDIQEYYHYLPKEVFPYVSQKIGVGTATLYGVATFYGNFSLEAKGKYIIRCCDGTACHVRGSQNVLHYLWEELGLSEKKHTTDDRLFTVETVSCLGACGLAPAMTINDKTYPLMTQEKIQKTLQEIRVSEKKASGGEEK
ncbi:MAG: NAD(P)H-dependent oxidoreductase subunit E [Eubacteriales bacterium]|nr:NAD(P)H-dependent oxidoreductase subunit E [Eubacteriales bacterium]